MFSRRTILAASAAALTTPLLTHSALAKAPIATGQSPGFIRTKVGTIEVTALSDGYTQFEPKALGADQTKAEDLAKQSPQVHPFDVDVNAYIVNSGDELTLIDAGAPSFYGPGVGRFHKALAAAGYSPNQVDKILLTHLHADHVAGLVNDKGQPLFDRAEVLIPEIDFAFWMTEEAITRAPDMAKPAIQFVQGAVNAYKGRISTFKGEKSVAKGVTATPIPGHTPGHTGYRVADGKDQLLIWADVVHLPEIQFAAPEITVPYDVDRTAAAASRKRVFDMVSADRITIAGMHMPFPGFGYVETLSEAYKFLPANWRHDM